MESHVHKTAVLALALAAGTTFALPTQALTITQWNFNSISPDNSTGTGSLTPSTGTGTALALGVTATFSSGASNNSSSDPVTVDDSGWQTTGYASQGTGNKTRGVEFKVSTLGMQDIVISYDLRHSNTSSRYEQVQYTLDGTNFIDIASFDGNAGDTWFNARTVDLSAISGADNNANFGFRVVASFAPGSSSYAASSTSYAGSGTWRFDMATVSGVAVTPVPEPQTYALMLAGLVAVGFVARRRRQG